MRKKKNIVIENLMVEDYAAEGKSLARKDGKVIFIEGAVPGDVIDVRLGKSKKDWAEGHPIQFRSYSKERVKPFCQHFGVCGGCQWQMLPYEKQLQYKHKQVFDNLTRIGKITLPEFYPIAGAEETKFYRNKLEYTFSTKEFTESKPQKQTKSQPHSHPQPLKGSVSAQGQEINAYTGDSSYTQEVNNEGLRGGNSPLGVGGVSEGEALGLSVSGSEALAVSERLGVVGFHAKGFFDKVVAIEKCWLQDEPTNSLRNAIRDFALEHKLSFYDIREHHGLLRTMQVRICTTGEVMVNIVFGEEKEKKIKQVLQFVEKEFPQITTLLYTINLKRNDSLFDLEPQVYKGKGYVIEKLEDFQFKIGPKSFFQTNTKQGEKLYQITREFAELDGSQVLYDLYCGTGSIGIFCSPKAKKIIGVEVVEAAVQDARENAALNKIEDASFFAGDVIEVCNDDFFAHHGRPDVIITDPPRAGMHEKLVRKILEMEAPTVVYVSCNPATQARDLALLDEKYEVTKVQPVDMFPHTHHIENVAQLKLRKRN